MLRDKIKLTMEIIYESQRLIYDGGYQNELGTIKDLKEKIGKEYFLELIEDEEKNQEFLDALRENGNDVIANDWIETGLYEYDFTPYISLKIENIEQTGYRELIFGWEMYYDINFQLNVKKLEKDYLAGKLKNI